VAGGSAAAIVFGMNPLWLAGLALGLLAVTEAKLLASATGLLLTAGLNVGVVAGLELSPAPGSAASWAASSEAPRKTLAPLHQGRGRLWHHSSEGHQENSGTTPGQDKTLAPIPWRALSIRAPPQRRKTLAPLQGQENSGTTPEAPPQSTTPAARENTTQGTGKLWHHSSAPLQRTTPAENSGTTPAAPLQRQFFGGWRAAGRRLIPISHCRNVEGFQPPKPVDDP